MYVNIRCLTALLYTLPALVITSGASVSLRDAGACSGPREWHGHVEPGSTVVHRICFTLQRRADVAVEGDGDSDLDCYIRSSAGSVVDSDTDATDYCILSWIPSRPNIYRIEIRNLGSVYNAYSLRTN